MTNLDAGAVWASAYSEMDGREALAESVSSYDGFQVHQELPGGLMST